MGRMNKTQLTLAFWIREKSLDRDVRTGRLFGYQASAIREMWRQAKGLRVYLQ